MLMEEFLNPCHESGIVIPQSNDASSCSPDCHAVSGRILNLDIVKYFEQRQYPLEENHRLLGEKCSYQPHAIIVLEHYKCYFVNFANTESSTPPKALSSASISSFFRCNSAKLRCPASPFVTGAVVSPEGTVGACRFSIVGMETQTSKVFETESFLCCQQKGLNVKTSLSQAAKGDAA